MNNIRSLVIAIATANLIVYQYYLTAANTPPHPTMEFDWLNPSFALKNIRPSEIEESFEDPFSLRLLPDSPTTTKQARYVCLGKSLKGRPLLSVFWTDGKSYRVIVSREMTEEELLFYERKNAETLF